MTYHRDRGFIEMHPRRKRDQISPGWVNKFVNGSMRRVGTWVGGGQEIELSCEKRTGGQSRDTRQDRDTELGAQRTLHVACGPGRE